jgi:signal transduction histidine kinase/ligand-binding sensor domain-containing protein
MLTSSRQVLMMIQAKSTGSQAGPKQLELSILRWVAAEAGEIAREIFAARPRHPVNARLPLHIVRMVCLIVVLLVSFGNRAQALDPPESSASYIIQKFTVEDGLLSNSVNAVLQTRDGFLWIGTQDGLLRFDGRHFTPIQFLPQASPILVSALAEAPDGALWVGTRAGLARISSLGSSELGRTVSSIYHPGSGDSDSVQCVHFSRNGDLWVGTHTGLYRFDHGRFSTIIPQLWTSRIEEAANGNLLVITSKGFVEWDGKQIIQHPDLPARLGVVQHGIFHVIEDYTGTRWYCTESGVARQVGGSIERLKPYHPGSGHPDVVYRLYDDQHGTVWFSQSGALYRVTAAGRQLVVPDLNINYLALDRDGDLWVGTRRGLFRLRRQAVKVFTAADGLPSGVPRAVLAARDGKLWVASNCGGVSWFDGQRFRTYAEKDGLTNSCVHSLAEDRNHNIWIGTFGGGVFRFRGGHFIQVVAPDRLVFRVVTAIVPASDGTLWIAYSDGLERISDGQVRRFTTADGLSSNSLLSAYEDRRGVLWVETTMGIDRLKKDRFVTVSTVDSGSTGQGRFGFGEDRLGELFAFGPANAIFRVQEDRVVRVNGAPRITGMAQSRENLWFCGDGIYRATPDSLQRWEREPETPPDYTLFNRADGMNSPECSGGFRNMAVTNDGRLWVAMEQGVAMLEISRLRHSDRKPAIFIEKIVIGKTVQPPGRELVLPAGTHHVELHFDTIELASPEAIRLQYRLDGVDREWLEADSSATAVYSGIPAGTHQFRVRACNSDGVWDPVGIFYNVTQNPSFYETNLFRLAAVTIFALLLAGAYWLRLRRITAQMNLRLDERVAERTRIARELHDTLLQSLHGVMFQFQAARNMLPRRTDEAIHTLDGAINATEQAIAESRGAILDLRTDRCRNGELGESLKATAQELADSEYGNSQAPAFRMIVEGEPKPLSSVLQDEVYRITREILRNSFQHAHADRIEVEIRYDDQALRLRIRDNGKGIDPQILKAGGTSGHWGLRGVRERARQIGAQLDFWSEVGAGTEVQLNIPAAVAYEAPGDGSKHRCSGIRHFLSGNRV